MKTITITNRRQIEDIIRKCPYCTVGMTDKEGNPYIVPMNFAWKNDTVYLHSGPEGSKVEMVVRHPQVCINFCEGRTGVYAQTSGMQLQHEIPQRYLQGQSAFHRRYE